MSIFKKALDYLTGKKELQDQINAINTKIEQKPENQKEIVCRNRIIYSVNTKNLTVITCDGDTFEAFNVEQTLIPQLRDADNETIIRLLSPKVEVKEDELKESVKEKELVSNFLDIFEGVDDFDVVGNSVYFKGIKSVEIPSLIVAKFIELLQKRRDTEVDVFTLEKDFSDLKQIDVEYQSLKSFTLKLLTSPRQESIDQVLSFCRHNNLRISKRGNIIGYRRVRLYKDVSMPDNSELIKFVKESIEKIKKWKKSPKNYWVNIQRGTENTLMLVENKIHELNLDGCLGNLYELYNNQSVLTSDKVQLYTSQHSYGKYTFAIGDIYKADEDDIDVDAGQCHSGGLHFASVDYDYGGYGEIPVVVLINPAKTITIPLNELRKGRTTEMKIACINPNEHGVHIDEDLIEEADEQYDEYVTEELLQAVANKTVVNLSVEEEVTQLSIPEIKNVTELLKSRVISV